jgi:hypothetical protein
VGYFDATARRAAKREAVGFFHWAMPRLDPALAFIGWLDTRTAPPSPETELTCDSLAEFAFADRPEAPWIIVTEFQTEPRDEDLERVMEYALRFRRERRPTSDPRLKYNVGGVLLNLTGPPQVDTLSMPIPGMEEFGLGGRITRLAVREKDAAGTLARIASGELSRCVLPWVALMRGSGAPEIIEEWKRLADMEADPRVRLNYAADALMFAELPGVWGEWKQALEGWNVRVSQQVMEWQAEARAEAQVETRRADLLRVLVAHCGAEVPADLASIIHGCTDPDQLSRWFDFALASKTYDEFRAAMSS